jgi:hypothetical protein
MKSYRTPQEAALGNITPERLIELAEAGYAPHYRIDGQGLFFKMMELREWLHRNLITVHAGMPMPTRLDMVVPPETRPASDAPGSISSLDGLRHIDLARVVCPGVYFLCLDDEVVYVGQSVNVPTRVMTHVIESRHPAGKTFDHARIFYLPTPESELLRVEAEFIRRLQPRYNTAPGYTAKGA